MAKAGAAVGVLGLALLIGAGPVEGPAALVVDDTPGARQPQVAVDSRGRVYVAYGVGGEIRCAASADGGRTFGRPVVVGSLPKLALGMRRGPRVAATLEAVVVTAIGGEKGMGQDGDVLAWRSEDGGRSWSGPERVNDVDASAREGLHGMAASADGRLYCVWLDLRNGKMELFGARSTDAGRTWEPDQLVYRSPDGPICTCCHPSAAFTGDGNLLVQWRNDLGEARDMYLIRSEDGGRTFGQAEKLGRKTWVLDRCPMDGGAIAAGRDGVVTTAWTRADQVFGAEPGQPERLLGPGLQPWAASGPSGAHAVWLRRRPGALLHLAPGERAARKLADKANDPVVASAPGGEGPVIAAWESDADASGGIVVTVLEPGR